MYFVISSSFPVQRVQRVQILNPREGQQQLQLKLIVRTGVQHNGAALVIGSAAAMAFILYFSNTNGALLSEW